MSRRRRSATGGASPDELLDRVYARLPLVSCRGLCQVGCGSVVMAGMEQTRIRERHGVELPLAGVFGANTARTALGLPDNRCPALDRAGRCRVYLDRPLVCRLYGVVRGMRCPYGCEPERWLPEHEARALIASVEELSRSACGRR